MRCPRCQQPDTRVIDSRVGKSGASIRRRRLCEGCNYRFSTLEEVLREGTYVVKRDGTREEFDREKLRRSVAKAFGKRNIDPEQLNALVAEVEIDLERNFDSDVPSREIAERVMERLKTVDPVAYVRFASVYREFAEVAQIEHAIGELRRQHPGS